MCRIMTQWFKPHAFARQRQAEDTTQDVKTYRLNDPATHPVDQPLLKRKDGERVPNTAMHIKTEHFAFEPYGDGTQLPLGGFKQVSKHREEDYAKPLTVQDIEERLDREFLQDIETQYPDVVGPLRALAAQGPTEKCIGCLRPRDNHKQHDYLCPVCLVNEFGSEGL